MGNFLLFFWQTEAFHFLLKWIVIRKHPLYFQSFEISWDMLCGPVNDYFCKCLVCLWKENASAVVGWTVLHMFNLSLWLNYQSFKCIFEKLSKKPAFRSSIMWSHLPSHYISLRLSFMHFEVEFRCKKYLYRIIIPSWWIIIMKSP